MTDEEKRIREIEAGGEHVTENNGKVWNYEHFILRVLCEIARGIHRLGNLREFELGVECEETPETKEASNVKG